MIVALVLAGVGPLSPDQERRVRALSMPVLRPGRRPIAYELYGREVRVAPYSMYSGEPVDMIPTTTHATVPTQRLPAVQTFDYGRMDGAPPKLRDINAPAPAPEPLAPMER